MDTGNLGGGGFRRRIEQAAEPLEPQDRLTYAAELRASWVRVSDRISRGAIQVVVLVVIFELLRAGMVTNVQFSGIAIRAQASVISQLALLGLSYSIFDVVLLTIRWSEIEIAHRIISTRVASPPISIDMDALLAPPLPAMWNPAHLISARNATHWSRLRAGAQWLLGTGICFGSVTFVIVEAAQGVFAGAGALVASLAALSGLIALYTAAIVVAWWFAERAL